MSQKLLTTLDAEGLAKLINLPAPTSPGDAVRKSYVDAVKAGLDWKDSVRAAGTANINLAAPGANIDGVSMSNGERFLAKDQTDAGDNGIYVWNGSAAAATRAEDADENADVTTGLTVAVAEGTVNANTVWILTTNDPIVVGTTDLAFTALGTTVDAGAGLTKTGNTLSLDVPVTVARGGTGSTTAAGARTNLGAPAKYAANITGDAAATTFNVTHNLGTTDVLVQVYEDATDDIVIVEQHVTDANTVRIGFLTAPANAIVYRVVVIG